MASHTERLRLLFDGDDIGWVVVTERVAKGIFGQLVPSDGFAKHRALFDEARRWAAANATPPEVAVDYDAWNRWLAIIEQLTSHVSLPELGVALEEFAVDQDLAVEVTLVRST